MSIQVTIDFRDQLPPVRDQGDRPTCTSHAISTAHEKKLELQEFLSPEYLHFFSTKGNPEKSASFEEAKSALESEGQPFERDCPYLSNTPAANWSPPLNPNVFKAKSNVSDSANLPGLGAVIKSSKLPVIGIELTDSFFVPKSPWIIEPDGSFRGLHAVVIVGHGNKGSGEYFLIRNSWGPGWGLDGYAWLETKYLASHLKRIIILEG